MKSKEELKKLFENGDKPTQEEFWEWQDSYWHKDEKLPTEAAGIYKIKGSVANLAALNALTGMEEGDVYNLLDNGDNYVYVLDLNNTSVAGWDKLSGIVDLSTVDLQTVLDNGGYASMGRNSIFMNLDNGGYNAEFFYSTDAGTRFTHSSQEIAFQSYYSDLTNTRIDVQKGGFKYREDYSQRPEFGDRNLVDKGYVDNAIANAGGGNFIPLSGTDSDKPLTAPIKFNNNNSETAIYQGDINSGYGSLRFDWDNGVGIAYGEGADIPKSSVTVMNESVTINVTNDVNTSNHSRIIVTPEGISLEGSTDSVAQIATDKGLTSYNDYTQNLQDLDYVQKKYVDDVTKMTRGIIDQTSFVVTNGSMVGTIEYEHTKGSKYITMRFNLQVSLQGDPAQTQALINLPFDIGISWHSFLSPNMQANISTNNSQINIQKINPDDFSFWINQCFVFPYGYETPNE